MLAEFEPEPHCSSHSAAMPAASVFSVLRVNHATTPATSAAATLG